MSGPPSSDGDPMLDLPTEIDPPEAEPPFAADEEPPAPPTAEELRERIDACLYLVEPVAVQLVRELGALVEKRELISVGRAALVEAARVWDPRRAALGAFVRQRLRWAMLDSVRRETHGRSVAARARALTAAERVLSVSALTPVDPMLPESAHARRLGVVLGAQAAALAAGLASGATQLPSNDGAPSPGLRTPLARHVVRPSEPPPVPTAADPEDEVGRVHTGEALRSALDELPPKQREIVNRHYFGEERFDHIAESLGISKSWASRLHAQAMEALAKALKDHR